MVQLSWMTMIVIVYNIWIPRHMFVFSYDLASSTFDLDTKEWGIMEFQTDFFGCAQKCS